MANGRRRRHNRRETVCELGLLGEACLYMSYVQDYYRGQSRPLFVLSTCTVPICLQHFSRRLVGCSTAQNEGVRKQTSVLALGASWIRRSDRTNIGSAAWIVRAANCSLRGSVAFHRVGPRAPAPSETDRNRHRMTTCLQNCGTVLHVVV
jgi:hypothetical protein